MVGLSEGKCPLEDPFEPIFCEVHVDTVGIASFLCLHDGFLL